MNKNKYGYKICYRLQNNKKLKMYLIVNTYGGALWHVRWYEKQAPFDRKTNCLLVNAEWSIIPIKTNIEFKRLWRGCPF
jgi:hypothetical protein